MFELNKLDYLKTATFASCTGCDAVYPFSIIEGFQDGQVFVDSLTDIKCVLFWHQSGFGYLAGKPSSDFLKEIVTQQMVHYILQQKKLPIWECNTSNLASKATAEKVGFRVLKVHPLFIKD